MFENTVVEKKKDKEDNKLFSQARELILNSKNYNFNQVLELIEEKTLEKDKAIVKILERFYFEEGALPNDLGKIYLEALFTNKNFSSDIYEKTKEINMYLREKGIIIDKEELAQVVKNIIKDN
jgi:hypothetical protein